MRSQLNQPIALRVDPNGKYPTFESAFNYIRDSIDFGGYGICVQSSGVTTDGFMAEGALTGITSPAALHFMGDATAIRRPTTGACFYAADGAKFQFDNFMLDCSQSDGRDPSSSVTCGNGCTIWQGPNVVFGDVAYSGGMPSYDIQAAFNSTYQFNADCTIAKTVIMDVASFNPSSNQMGVSNPGGIKPYMSIHGIGNNACYVQAINGAWVTIGGGLPSFSAGGGAVSFSAGSMAFIQGDPQSFITSGPIKIIIANAPYWVDGFISGDHNETYMQGLQLVTPGGGVINQSNVNRTFFSAHNGALILT